MFSYAKMFEKSVLATMLHFARVTLTHQPHVKSEYLYLTDKKMLKVNNCLYSKRRRKIKAYLNRHLFRYFIKNDLDKPREIWI